MQHKLIQTLLSNLSQTGNEQHNVKMLSLIRQLSPQYLDKAIQIFQSLRYQITLFWCTQPTSVKQQQRHFYQIKDSKSQQFAVLIPSSQGLDCTCTNYLKGLTGEGHRYCEHVLCVKIVNRLKDKERMKLREVGLLEYVNQIKGVVIV